MSPVEWPGIFEDRCHKEVGVGRPAKATRYYPPRITPADRERLAETVRRSEARLARAREIAKELGLEDGI